MAKDPMFAEEVTQELIDKAVAFHGHWCPGLARGVRAGAWIARHFGTASDEEIVAITETDMCAVDAIQVITGCTFGKGNLLYRDLGKIAFTFFRRSDGKGVRLVKKFRDNAQTRYTQELKKQEKNAVSPEELQRIQKELEEQRRKDIEEFLSAPFEDLFDIKEPQCSIPPCARLFTTERCHACGEGVMASRTRTIEGKIFCIPCADKEVALKGRD